MGPHSSVVAAVRPKASERKGEDLATQRARCPRPHCASLLRRRFWIQLIAEPLVEVGSVLPERIGNVLHVFAQ